MKTPNNIVTHEHLIAPWALWKRVRELRPRLRAPYWSEKLYYNTGLRRSYVSPLGVSLGVHAYEYGSHSAMWPRTKSSLLAAEKVAIQIEQYVATVRSAKLPTGCVWTLCDVGICVTRLSDGTTIQPSRSDLGTPTFRGKVRAEFLRAWKIIRTKKLTEATPAHKHLSEENVAA